VLNALSRTHEEPDLTECEIPLNLPELTVPPIANCSRYDELLTGGVYATR